jgi:hypothetical protein
VVATPSRSLWHDLWLNVKPQRLFLEQGGDAEKKQPTSHFHGWLILPKFRPQVVSPAAANPSSSCVLGNASPYPP